MNLTYIIFMRKTHTNIIANYVSKIWSFVSIYIFIPIYINLLGIENYGVIAFYSTLSAFMVVADGGLTATLSREFAGKGFKDHQYAATLLHTFERAYIIILLIVICVIFFFSDFIVRTWLTSESIPYGDLVIYVKIMGVIVATQLFSSLHQGGLMGLQKQVLANTLYISYNFARSALVIFILLFDGGLLGYFIWQLICIIIYLLFLIHYLKKSLSIKSNHSINFKLFSNIWKYSLGMMYISILTAFTTQIDKLTIANYLSVGDLGKYSLAASLGQIAYIISYPIMIAIFPELTNNIFEYNKNKALKLLHKYAYFISCISFMSVAILFVFSYDVIAIWTTDLDLAILINKPFRMLLIGGTFLALQLIPYYWALANKHTKSSIIVDTTLVIFLFLLLPHFIKVYGMEGAAIIWMILNIVSFILLSLLVFSKYMSSWNDIIRWIIIDIVTPLITAITISVSLFYITKNMPHGYWVIIYSFIGGCLILLLDIIIYKKMKNKYL